MKLLRNKDGNIIMPLVGFIVSSMVVFTMLYATILSTTQNLAKSHELDNLEETAKIELEFVTDYIKQQFNDKSLEVDEYEVKSAIEKNFGISYITFENTKLNTYELISNYSGNNELYREFEIESAAPPVVDTGGGLTDGVLNPETVILGHHQYYTDAHNNIQYHKNQVILYDGDYYVSQIDGYHHSDPSTDPLRFYKTKYTVGSHYIKGVDGDIRINQITYSSSLTYTKYDIIYDANDALFYICTDYDIDCGIKEIVPILNYSSNSYYVIDFTQASVYDSSENNFNKGEIVIYNGQPYIANDKLYSIHGTPESNNFTNLYNVNGYGQKGYWMGIEEAKGNYVYSRTEPVVIIRNDQLYLLNKGQTLDPQFSQISTGQITEIPFKIYFDESEAKYAAENNKPPAADAYFLGQTSSHGSLVQGYYTEAGQTYNYNGSVYALLHDKGVNVESYNNPEHMYYDWAYVKKEGVDEKAQIYDPNKTYNYKEVVIHENVAYVAIPQNVVYTGSAPGSNKGCVTKKGDWVYNACWQELPKINVVFVSGENDQTEAPDIPDILPPTEIVIEGGTYFPDNITSRDKYYSYFTKGEISAWRAVQYKNTGITMVEYNNSIYLLFAPILNRVDFQTPPDINPYFWTKVGFVDDYYLVSEYNSSFYNYIKGVVVSYQGTAYWNFYDRNNSTPGDTRYCDAIQNVSTLCWQEVDMTIHTVKAKEDGHLVPGTGTEVEVPQIPEIDTDKPIDPSNASFKVGIIYKRTKK